MFEAVDKYEIFIDVILKEIMTQRAYIVILRIPQLIEVLVK